MKIKISVTDDSGKEYEGTFDLPIKGSSSKGKKERSQPPKNNNYKGLSGGIRFLKDNGFFDNPKSTNETYAELKKEGYYHSLQSVDGALRNNFVSRNKILVRTEENEVWKYVLRE